MLWFNQWYRKRASLYCIMWCYWQKCFELFVLVVDLFTAYETNNSPRPPPTPHPPTRLLHNRQECAARLWKSLQQHNIAMASCKTVVSPLPTHWGYCGLVLSHQYSNRYLGNHGWWRPPVASAERPWTHEGGRFELLPSAWEHRTIDTLANRNSAIVNWMMFLHRIASLTENVWSS